MNFKTLIVAALSAVLLAAAPAFAGSPAAGKKTFDEPTFIKMLGRKTRAEVIGLLGQPDKKQLSVKPVNAETVIGRPLKGSEEAQKTRNVEMWYYSNIVRYDAKNTYKTTELTFVDGRCTDVAFFNNR